MRVLGRLVGVFIAVVVVVFTVGVFVTVLNEVDPGWFHHVVSWARNLL